MGIEVGLFTGGGVGEGRERLCLKKERCYSDIWKGVNAQNKYNSTIFINPTIFVYVDGTLTFNKYG